MSPKNNALMLGALYFFGAVPALFVPLIIGPLSDRCSLPLGRRRPYIIGGALIGAVGLLLMMAAYGVRLPWLYIAAYLVLQVGANIALAAYSGVIPDLVPTDQRGVASGYMGIMSQVGTLVGAFVGGSLARTDSNSLFLILAGTLALFGVFSLWAIPEHQFTEHPAPLDWKAVPKELFEPLKHHDFRWVWITRALMMLGFYAIQPFLLYYLRDVIKVADPSKDSPTVFAIILLAATVSAIVGGKISDKTGRKPVVIWSSVIIAVTALAFTALSQLREVLIVGIVFGLGYGAYISVDWALGADVLPNQHDAGKDMAVWHIAMTLPQQVAPLMAGSMLAIFSGSEVNGVATYLPMGYDFLFAFGAVCFLAGGILVKKVQGAR
jgi:MFS family permease